MFDVGPRAAQESANLELAAETYARVGVAVADAVIAVWCVKYQHNLIRPITYIRKVIDRASAGTRPV